MEEKKRKVGIGFATGRKSFQKVLRSYIHNWVESDLVDNRDVSLNIFVAYDLSFSKTRKEDFINIRPDLAENIDRAVFIGGGAIRDEIAKLSARGVVSASEARMIFGRGYASQRNAILYSAIKEGMSDLIFLDDDEYPVAVTDTQKYAVWGGQQVVSAHLKYLEMADLTHGHHCGYISPIPYMEFNETLKESDFRIFIEAISNDILNWENVRAVMNKGGVTYADTRILTGSGAKEVEEVRHAKFISGANLGIRLSDPGRVFAFYNPLGARGEDTFLSTCLSERTVLKVPCYTFHDGFSTYHHILEGVLPIRLKFIRADSEAVVSRFYRTCIGWIRYKPLLLYITQREGYEAKTQKIRRQLDEVLPKMCEYLGVPEFMNIRAEFDKYDRNVRKHYQEFIETQRIWAKLMDDLERRHSPGS